MTKLSELVPEGAILPTLQTQDRDGAVAELVRALASSGAIPPAMEDELRERVLSRERTASTGFGKGVAVPHAKHASLTKLVAAVGLSQRGVAFASIDEQPVYIVFLLLSPADQPEEHLRAMEVLFKQVSKDTFRRMLRQCQSAGEVRALLADADAQRMVV